MLIELIADEHIFMAVYQHMIDVLDNLIIYF